MSNWKYTLALSALFCSAQAAASSTDAPPAEEPVVVNLFGPAGQYVYIDDRPIPAQLPAQMSLNAGTHTFILVTEDDEKLFFLREINAFQEGHQVNVVLTDARGPIIRVTEKQP